jgi:DNA polymerase/3'-5' exonuclease PolX
MELEKIQPVANDIVDFIRPHCSRAEVAGSIRRQKADVKDVEIVAIVNDWDGLFNSLTAFGHFIKPGTPDIEPWEPKKNAKYLRMMLDVGLKLDLFIASPENWGGIFMMRTGSGVGPDGNPFNGFVPTMFSRWKKLSAGGRMSGCMPQLADGSKVVVLREEIDIFNLLGVHWVEPRERIGRAAVKKLTGYALDLSKFELR